MNSTDEKFMLEALNLAKKGMGRVSPNPMVGAVIVKDGIVVGRGFHRAVGEAHAEVNAIHDAGESARGATLYVTLEPCNHYGRTPPCTDAILRAGIKKVVIGMLDPNPHVTGGGADRLCREGVEVVSGILEDECRYLNRTFIKYVTTGFPYVIAKSAMTLDGKIATRTGDSKWITSELARRFVHKLRSEVDAICVGIGTAIADNPLLTVRYNLKKSHRKPIRIVIDRQLRISEDSDLVQTAKKVPCWVFHGEDCNNEKLRKLEARGLRLICIPTTETGHLDLREIFRWLGKEQVTSVLVEGGAGIFGGLFESLIDKKSVPLVDEVCFFYAPKILADPEAISLFSSGAPRFYMSEAIQLERVTIKKFGHDVMIRGILSCSQVL
ncbi:MAG: bifunctional diaminohydroxyphosphoribosylaminopyrimidine deaminase/5-amino-6-(5-phosphoribosylamino)uracil reductase RibD [Thermodesulforhabdaceae bacterium]